MVAEKNGAVELKAAKSSMQQQHKRKIRNERNIYLTSFKNNKIYTKEFSISTKHFELHVNRNDDSVAGFFSVFKPNGRTRFVFQRCSGHHPAQRLKMQVRKCKQHDEQTISRRRQSKSTVVKKNPAQCLEQFARCGMPYLFVLFICFFSSSLLSTLVLVLNRKKRRLVSW